MFYLISSSLKKVKSVVIWCFPWFSCNISLKGNLEFSPFLESKAIKTRFCSRLSICQHEVWCLKMMYILPPLRHPSWWKACWCFWERRFQLWKILKCLFISVHMPDHQCTYAWPGKCHDWSSVCVPVKLSRSLLRDSRASPSSAGHYLLNFQDCNRLT